MAWLDPRILRTEVLESLVRIRKRWPILGVLALVLVGVAQSVLGNRVDAALLPLWPHVLHWLDQRTEIANWLLAALALIVALLGVVGARLLVQAAHGRSKRLDIAIALVELDETLFRLLAQLASAPDRRGAVVKLLEEFLRDTTRVLGGDVSRAMVLHAVADELVGWVGYQMPQATLDRTRFRLDAPDTAGQGVALKTFRDGKTYVVHLDQDREQWRADSRDYKVIDLDRPHPPYRSFATAAIPGAGGETLGVLCFDSMSREAFDSVDIQRFLSALAQRVSAVITIYHRLGDSDSLVDAVNAKRVGWLSARLTLRSAWPKEVSVETILAERGVAEQLPPEESERRLIDASGRYLRGEMSVEDFEDAERRYMPNYRSVIRTLAERHRRIAIGGLRRFAEQRVGRFTG
jgi:hypothetical protein